MIMQPLTTGGGGSAKSASGSLADVPANGKTFDLGFKPSSLVVAGNVSYTSGGGYVMYAMINNTVVRDKKIDEHTVVTVTDTGFSITPQTNYTFSVLTGGWCAK